jgi:hypothetical protein
LSKNADRENNNNLELGKAVSAMMLSNEMVKRSDNPRFSKELGPYVI